MQNVSGHLLCALWFEIHGFFYSSFKPSVSSGQEVYIVVLRGMILLLQM